MTDQEDLMLTLQTQRNSQEILTNQVLIVKQLQESFLDKMPSLLTLSKTIEEVLNLSDLRKRSLTLKILRCLYLKIKPRGC
jgi:hypothetical protein